MPMTSRAIGMSIAMNANACILVDRLNKVVKWVEQFIKLDRMAYRFYKLRKLTNTLTKSDDELHKLDKLNKF